MRRTVLLSCLGLAACASALTVVRAQLPAALDEIVLVEGHPQITPVVFQHGMHAALDGQSCASCHHELRDDPTAVPRRCTECHTLAYLLPDEPEIDESKPHVHTRPPDL